ncbi:MAG TPA: hypothetical protein VF785_18420 [Gemmatimonadaceae bacterium]
MTESDRQLLAPLLTSGGPYMFGRGGDSPAEIAEFERRAEPLLAVCKPRVTAGGGRDGA